MEKKKLKGAAAPEQISMWKEAHGDVFQLTVEDSTCYLRKPDRTTLKLLMSFDATQQIRANEILLENCWLGGDAAIKTDDEKFLSVMPRLGEIIELKEAELGKL